MPAPTKAEAAAAAAKAAAAAAAAPAPAAAAAANAKAPERGPAKAEDVNADADANADAASNAEGEAAAEGEAEGEAEAAADADGDAEAEPDAAAEAEAGAEADGDAEAAAAADGAEGEAEAADGAGEAEAEAEAAGDDGDAAAAEAEADADAAEPADGEGEDADAAPAAAAADEGEAEPEAEAEDSADAESAPEPAPAPAAAKPAAAPKPAAAAAAPAASAAPKPTAAKPAAPAAAPVAAAAPAKPAPAPVPAVAEKKQAPAPAPAPAESPEPKLIKPSKRAVEPAQVAAPASLPAVKAPASAASPGHARKQSGSSSGSIAAPQPARSGTSPQPQHSRSPSNGRGAAATSASGGASRPKSLDSVTHAHRRNDSLSSSMSAAGNGGGNGSGAASPMPVPDEYAFTENNEYTRLKKRLLRTIYDELTKTFGALDPYKVQNVLAEVNTEYQARLRVMEEAQEKERKMMFPSLANASRPGTQKSRVSTSPERRSVSTAGGGGGGGGGLSSTIRTNVFTVSGMLPPATASSNSPGNKDQKALMRTSLSQKALTAMAAANPNGTAAVAVQPKFLDGQLMCCWVSDMSGVTSLMRKVGVVHGTAQIMKMREILEPIIHAYKCWTQEREADDLVCTFRSPLAGLAAAFESLVAVDEYNAELKDDDFKISVSGIAMDASTNVHIETKSGEIRLFGPCFSRASYLGQFVADGGQLLVGMDMYERIKGYEVCRQYFTFTKRQLSDWVGPGTLTYYELDWRQGDVEAIMAAFDAHNLKYVEGQDIPKYRGDREAKIKPEKREFLALMKARDEAQSEQELAAIDKSIQDQWLLQERTVLYADFSFAKITQNTGLAVEIYQQLCILIRNTMLHNRGLLVDWQTAVFARPADAVWAALQLRELVRNHNSRVGGDAKSEDRWLLNGIGIARGDVLYVPATDVAFGDPVNIAAKLAIDVARHEQVLVTAEPFEPVREKMLRVVSAPITVKIGSVGETACYELQKVHALKKKIVESEKPKFDPIFG